MIIVIIVMTIIIPWFLKNDKTDNEIRAIATNYSKAGYTLLFIESKLLN